MKNTLFLPICVSLLGLISCAKENTCTCTTTSNGSTMIMTTKATTNKKNAESWCKGIEKTVYVQGGQTVVLPWSCKLD